MVQRSGAAGRRHLDVRGAVQLTRLDGPDDLVRGRERGQPPAGVAGLAQRARLVAVWGTTNAAAAANAAGIAVHALDLPGHGLSAAPADRGHFADRDGWALALGAIHGLRGYLDKAYPGLPLFFSQVKDAVAYLRMPEQSDTVTIAYVSDMGTAPSWDDVGAMNWIAAASAVYVIGSDAKGGMDAAEFVPFSDPAKAQAFAAQNGGQVVAFDQIPQSAFDAGTPPETDDADFSARLKSLSGTGG